VSVRGWVYVIANKAMPDLVKVGYSTKDPILRAQDFDGTGIPHSYEVVYDALVLGPREVEQKAHKALANFREAKEWFRCSADVAVRAIKQSAEKILQETAHLEIGGEVATRSLSQKCTHYGCSMPPTKDYKGNPLCEDHWLKERRDRFGGVRQVLNKELNR
jgi:hypothetical protein